MPKARQTCTRCSMRRQRCDKEQPCTRCVQAGEAEECTRTWTNGYDPRIHRSYPKSSIRSAKRPREGSQSDDSPSDRTSQVRGEAPWYYSPSRPTRGDAQAQQNLNITGDLTRDKSVLQATNPYIQQLGTDLDVREVDHYRRYRRQEVLYLQQSLPNKQQLWSLVDYHEYSLMWVHNTLHGPTFRKEVENALKRGKDSIIFEHHDLKWCGLLFAVLTVSLTCLPVDQAKALGFDAAQKAYLSKRWHEAAMECLVLGGYASKPSVCTIQTIQVLAFASHVLGLSNQQFVMFGTSVRVAQTLGLNRLPSRPGSSNDSDEVLRVRETSRRIWWNLVIQDWFSICSTEMYSIPPNQFQVPRPQPYDTICQEDAALAEYDNHIIDVATVMVDFHIATLSCTDDSARYQEVLRHDARLRQLEARPICPANKTSVWLPWARSVCRVCTPHKVIILHRQFLGRSFRDPVYAFTRWASINASKSIIRELSSAIKDPTRPIIWNDQAHLTGAGVTLCLDLMHRSPGETELTEHRATVDEAMTILSENKDSVLASRGHKLLSSMLKKSSVESTSKAMAGAFACPTALADDSVAWPIESSDSLRTVAESAEATQQVFATPDSQTELPAMSTSASTMETVDMTPSFGLGSFDDVLNDASWTELLAEYFPDQLGFGNALDFNAIHDTLGPY